MKLVTTYIISKTVLQVHLNRFAEIVEAKPAMLANLFPTMHRQMLKKIMQKHFLDDESLR